VQIKDLEPKYNDAIRHVIGERLRLLLTRNQAEFSPDLMDVFHRFQFQEASTTIGATLLSQKRHLLDRLQKESSSNQRGQIELLLSKIDTALDLLEYDALVDNRPQRRRLGKKLEPSREQKGEPAN